MTPDQIARIAAMLNDIRSIEGTLRAMHFELAEMLDVARGYVADEPELEEAA